MIVFLPFLCFFIWSSCFTLGRATLQYSSPLFLTGSRMLIAGALILAFILITQKRVVIKRKQWLPLILLGLSSVYLCNALEFWGLQYMTAAKASFIYSLTPFIAAILSYFQLKEKMTSRKFLGLFIGFLGFFPVLYFQGGAKDIIGGIGFLSWADLALVGATLTSSYGWVLMRKLGKDDNVSPLLANGVSMAIGGIFALTHSFVVEDWNPVPVTEFTPFFEGVGMMIVVSNLICYNLYGYLLKHLTATYLSFVGLMTPLFASFFGWVFLSETVSWTFFLSVGIILFGLWHVYAEELRMGYLRKKIEAEKIPTD